jgi:hypothetical protein
MRSINAIKTQLLAEVEAGVTEGFYLSRGGLLCGFFSPESGVCLAGMVCRDKIDDHNFNNFRQEAEQRLGISERDWLALEAGFEGQNAGVFMQLEFQTKPATAREAELSKLGAQIANDFGAISET